MKTYTFEGKTKEAAVELALEELKISEEDLIINNITEKSGLLKKSVEIEVLNINEIITFIKETISKITKLMGNITVIDITKLKQEYDNYPISGNMVASIFTESMYLLNLIDEIDEVVDRKIIDDNLLIVETWMKNHEYYFRKNADLYLTPEQMHNRAAVATALNVKISI
mgnify:CR=1 FL=1